MIGRNKFYLFIYLFMLNYFEIDCVIFFAQNTHSQNLI